MLIKVHGIEVHKSMGILLETTQEYVQSLRNVSLVAHEVGPRYPLSREDELRLLEGYKRALED